MSVRPSIRVEKLGSHKTDIYLILHYMIFRQYAEKIKFSLKPEKNNAYFT